MLYLKTFNYYGKCLICICYISFVQKPFKFQAARLLITITLTKHNISTLIQLILGHYFNFDKSYLILEGRYWCHRFFSWVIFQYLSVALGHELKGEKTRVDPFHPNVTYPLCENWKLILLMIVHDASCFVQCT